MSIESVTLKALRFIWVDLACVVPVKYGKYRRVGVFRWNADLARILGLIKESATVTIVHYKESAGGS
jgi:hypothetical protein